MTSRARPVLAGSIAAIALSLALHGCGKPPAPAPVAEAQQIDEAVSEAERRANAARASTGSPPTRPALADPAA